MREGSFFSEFSARDLLHPVKYTQKQIRRRTTNLGLMPGKFNYDEKGWKWGDVYINKIPANNNSAKPKEEIVSPEFLATDEGWKNRPANNDENARAKRLFLRLKEEYRLADLEKKRRDATPLMQLIYRVKERKR